MRKVAQKIVELLSFVVIFWFFIGLMDFIGEANRANNLKKRTYHEEEFTVVECNNTLVTQFIIIREPYILRFFLPRYYVLNTATGEKYPLSSCTFRKQPLIREVRKGGESLRLGHQA